MFAPRIVTNSGVAGAAVTWNASVSMPERWMYRSKGVGGTARFGPFSQESFQRYRDELVDVVIVFTEAEWTLLRPHLIWAQISAQPFMFRFDKNDAATEYSVYLESPAMGDEIKPDKVEGTVFAFQLALTLRSADGTPFDVKITSL